MLKDAEQFVRRAWSVGATLNEVTNNDVPLRAQLKKLVHHEGDWLGARIDYRNKRVKLTEKCIDKLVFLRKHLLSAASLSARTLAAIFGILLFSSTIVDCNLPRRFVPLQFFRKFSTEVSENMDLWDGELVVPPRTKEELVNWIDCALRNDWRGIRKRADHPWRVIFSDASSWGWGGACYDPATGSMEFASKKWALNEVNVDRSVETEPLGVIKNLCRWIPPSLPKDTTVWIVSDNVTAISIINGKLSGSWNSNKFASTMRSFKHLQLVGSTSKAPTTQWMDCREVWIVVIVRPSGSKRANI